MPKKNIGREDGQNRHEMVKLSSGFSVDRATAEVCWEVNRGGKMMHTTTAAEHPDREHPDVRVVQTWLAKQGRPNDELEIIFRLCYVVRSEWQMLPKRTKSEHRKLYLRIESLCHELQTALDDSVGGTGWGLRRVRVSRLLNDIEKSTFPEESDYPGIGSGRSIKGHFPFVEELLQRLADEASKLAIQGPLHTQPSKRGAERGYFVRRIGELFQQRYGEQPQEVIAALTTIALGEATDRDLVAKLLK